MSRAEPGIQTIGVVPDAMADGAARVVTASPLPAEPLQSWPRRHRAAWVRAVDGVAVTFNRLIEQARWAKALHRRALARIEMTDVVFGLAGSGGLDGLTIAFLSDLHAGNYLDGGDLLAIAEAVAAREPDLVCLGGDLINSRATELEMLEGALRRLRPPLGCFAVPGNHDHRWHGDMGRWQAWLESFGVVVLNNHGVRVQRGGDSLWLCGVDDLSDGRPDLRRALTGRRPGEPTVLLAHQPDQFPLAVEQRVELTLSGHTHGGQVRLLGWAPITHTRCGYRAGAYRDADSTLYVSRGVGASLLPLRAGAPAEIPFVRIVAD